MSKVIPELCSKCLMYLQDLDLRQNSLLATYKRNFVKRIQMRHLSAIEEDRCRYTWTLYLFLRILYAYLEQTGDSLRISGQRHCEMQWPASSPKWLELLVIVRTSLSIIPLVWVKECDSLLLRAPWRNDIRFFCTPASLAFVTVIWC